VGRLGSRASSLVRILMNDLSEGNTFEGDRATRTPAQAIALKVFLSNVLESLSAVWWTLLQISSMSE
jgi:hypothetical protein